MLTKANDWRKEQVQKDNSDEYNQRIKAKWGKHIQILTPYKTRREKIKVTCKGSDKKIWIRPDNLELRITCPVCGKELFSHK